jgi:hypothetical protein
MRTSKESPCAVQSEGVINQGDSSHPQYCEMKETQDHSAPNSVMD